MPDERMIKILTFLIILLMFPLLLTSQNKGCTDKKAINYDPAADHNDGSCLYDTTTWYPECLVHEMPYILRENSGIIYYNGGVWTHNDSGGKAEIYKLDLRSGRIVQTIRILGAKNHDWEDIAQDTGYIYIGDFGNNNGTRKDLCIYKIPKNGIPEKKDAGIRAEVITFHYGDQTDFLNHPQSHDYDCEALISNGDSLYLFTKDWNDLKSRVYALPCSAGDYTVFPHDGFDAGGLITGADINPQKKEVTLVGYHDYISFIYLLFDYNENDFFSGNKRRIDFPEMVFVQTEGVAYMDSKTVLISCEESAVPPGVYRVNISSWTNPFQSSRIYTPIRSIDIEMFGKTDNRKYFFHVRRLPDPTLKIEVYNDSWTRQDSENNHIFYDMRSSTLSLDFNNSDPGTYFIKLISGKEQQVVKIFVEQ